MIVYSTNKKINGSILNDKFNTNYRIIRRFLRVVDKFGYKCQINSISYSGSCYIGFSKINSNIDDFIFRFSDHLLSAFNQVPNGVICEYTCIGMMIKDFQYHLSQFNRMTTDEAEKLWNQES